MRRPALLVWWAVALLLLTALVGTRHTHDSDGGLAPNHECVACAWQLHGTAVVVPVDLIPTLLYLAAQPLPLPTDPVLPSQFSVATASRAPPALHG